MQTDCIDFWKATLKRCLINVKVDGSCDLLSTVFYDYLTPQYVTSTKFFIKINKIFCFTELCQFA